MPKLTSEQIAEKKRNGPKKTTGGNVRCDQEWIAEMTAAGEIIEPDLSLKPQGFVDDVRLQWTGYAEEANPDFFEEFRQFNNGRRCTAQAYVRDERGGYVIDIEWQRIRRPCLRPPAVGTTICLAHGAKIPAVKAAAERVIAEAAETVAHRLVGLTNVRDEIQEVIDHKVRLAAANSVLDRAGIKGGVTVEVQMPGYKKVLESMFADEDATDGD